MQRSGNIFYQIYQLLESLIFQAIFAFVICLVKTEEKKDAARKTMDGRSVFFEMYILSIYFSTKSLGSHFCFPIDVAD